MTAQLALLLSFTIFGADVQRGGAHRPEQDAAAQAMATEPVVRFVLIVGNNKSLDPTLPDLAYADDDAALYAELFEPVAGKIALLTTLDDESQRRFPSSAAKTLPPTKAELRAQLRDFYESITETKALGTKVDLFFVFVGHGSIDEEGRGFVHLLDGPLTRHELFQEIISESPADRTHIIVDACHAVSFVAGRGGRPDAPRPRTLDDFLAGHELERHPRVGVLFAYSDDRETHEWSRIRSGIFSHQLRSALSGAADINHDNQIEYSEVAAFISAANANLDRLGKRLSTFAWPPLQARNASLLELGRSGRLREVRIAPKLAGRMFIESEAGVRAAEFHKASGQVLKLFLQKGVRYFLRNKTHEASVPDEASPATIEALVDALTHVVARGAVDQAFETGLFGTPFTEAFYRGYIAERPYLVPVTFSQGNGDPGNEGPAATSGVPTKQPLAPEPNLQVWDPAHSPKARVFDLSLGYRIGPSPVRSRNLEHGVRVELIHNLDEAFFVGIDLEIAIARFNRDAHSYRGMINPKAGYRWSLLESLTTSLTLDAGYGVLFLRGPATSTDPSVFSAGARAGISLALTDAFDLSLSGGVTFFLLSFVEGESIRTRPEATLSAGWSF